MTEHIEREKAIELLSEPITMSMCLSMDEYPHKIAQRRIDLYLIENIPAADVREVVKAKWEDVHIDRPEIADLEVASMFCPNCNRWHNEVYHYGNPIEFANYCQFCGADMRSKEDADHV